MVLVRVFTDMNQPQSFVTLLGTGQYARDSAPYKLLEVAGPDAGEFLHRLCSQDVRGLKEGDLVPAAFLDAKGKLQATVLVFRYGESFWLEIQAEQAERLQALLERYHFTEKLAIHGRDLGPVAEHIDGHGSANFVGRSRWREQAQAVVVHVERRGAAFTRCHGGALTEADVEKARGGGLEASDVVVSVVAASVVAASVAAASVVAASGATGAGVAVAGAAAPGGLAAVAAQPMPEEIAEAARMLAGFVRIGIETEASTLALEADLDDHCSTSKGCYTGQEIVARIHTYGHVNRKLCLLRLPSGDPIDAPVALHETEDDIPVGRVMHAIPLVKNDMRLGLGYLPKDFQAIGTKLTLAGNGEVEVIGFAADPAKS